MPDHDTMMEQIYEHNNYNRDALYQYNFDNRIINIR